jgi:glucan phosphoethanolaminetransferase (alkaline phosphatase superfamily)
MMRFIHIVNQGSQRANAAWGAVQRQPSWIVKTCAAVAAMLVLIPLLAVVLIVIAVVFVVFLVLWAINWVLGGFKSFIPKRDGRENVRVIRRDDGPGA